jgi:peptide chain release factor 1
MQICDDKLNEILETTKNQLSKLDIKNANDKKLNSNLNSRKTIIEKIFELKNQILSNVEQIKKEKDLEELFLLENVEIESAIEDECQKLLNSYLSNTNETAIMEIRSGQGGDESSIFALEILNMYEKLAKKMNWPFKILETQFKESEKLKEASFEISGKNVFSYLKQESGVHCVKRVPKTEKKGRIHTSTITVAVLKEPNEVEVVLNPKDLRIDTFRSGGPGGQSVNTTDSAIRITHIPTQIVVSQQDEKSQHANKAKALKILKARIFARMQEEEDAKNAAERRQAVGSASREERIRTYHFNQNWVKDCRIEKECHDVTSFMEGHILVKFLDELIWNLG